MIEDQVKTSTRQSSPASSEELSTAEAEVPAEAEAYDDDYELRVEMWERSRQERDFLRRYRRRRILAWTLLTLSVILILLIAGAYTGRLPLQAPTVARIHGWYALLAASLGAAVGASELVSRYRDEPVRALGSMAAFMYLLVNAVISACTYFLLTRYGKAIIPTLVNDPLMRSIVAGFGAMAILRSKFFTLRTERGEDVSVGPDAAISTFLSAADRGVDRSRAANRLGLVFDRTSEISSYKEVKEFIRTSLWAFQNVRDDEQTKLRNRIKEIYEDGAEYPNDTLRLQALCYYILAIVGEQDFNQLMDNLVEYTKRRNMQAQSSEQIGETKKKKHTKDRGLSLPRPSLLARH